jgi:GAF domain-containing protein
LTDQQYRSTRTVGPGSQPLPAQSQRTDVAAALAAASKLLHRQDTPDRTLVTVVETARATVPGVDGAAISLLVEGSLKTLAATSDVVDTLGRAQAELGEGPCLDALGAHGLVVAEDLLTDDRWPRYVARAREAGLRAQLAIQLHDDDRTLGVLDLYSTRSGTVGHTTVRVAELFAVHAGLALLNAQHRQQMNDALTTRKLIGQAIGLVMERYKIDDQRAFEFLVRISQSTNVKIRDVAEEMVTQAAGRPAGEDD